MTSPYAKAKMLSENIANVYKWIQTIRVVIQWGVNTLVCQLFALIMRLVIFFCI